MTRFQASHDRCTDDLTCFFVLSKVYLHWSLDFITTCAPLLQRWRSHHHTSRRVFPKADPFACVSRAAFDEELRSKSCFCPRNVQQCATALRPRPRTLVDTDAFYTGQWLGEKRHGYGQIEKKGIGVYDGEFVHLALFSVHHVSVREQRRIERAVVAEKWWVFVLCLDLLFCLSLDDDRIRRPFVVPVCTTMSLGGGTRSPEPANGQSGHDC